MNGLMLTFINSLISNLQTLLAFIGIQFSDSKWQKIEDWWLICDESLSRRWLTVVGRWPWYDLSQAALAFFQQN